MWEVVPLSTPAGVLLISELQKGNYWGIILLTKLLTKLLFYKYILLLFNAFHLTVNH